MKSMISYKNYLIRGESFQLATRDNWVPRYSVARQESKSPQSGKPSGRDCLDKVFGSEVEADNYALQAAMVWIDGHLAPVVLVSEPRSK